MRNLLTIALISCISVAHAQSHFKKDPYAVTFIENTHYKPDARVQQNLREADVWQNFIGEHGKWSVEFNELNGMPHRAYGAGIETTGSTPEERAMNFMSAELNGFNPVSDQLVLNKVNTSPKYQYVHFRQQYEGLDVLWSEATFRISNDGKIVMFGLDVYNNISVSTTPALDGTTAGSYAAAGIDLTITSVEILPGLKILPVKAGSESGAYEYKLVYEVFVHTKDAENIPGKYYTLVDAQNGKVYYRQNRVHACGAPLMDAGLSVSDDVASNPLVATESFRLPYLRVDVEGDTYYTDVSGNLDIPGITEDTEVEVFLRGLYAKVYQNNGVELPSFIATISPGENALTFPATTNLSAVSAYYYQNVVHDYMKFHWPDFDDLDIDQRINTDLDDVCNAYYDGTSTNFFEAGDGCANTALFSDVVMHEYGHGINYDLYFWLGLSPFGMTNGAMHEAYADLWGICNTHNPILAQGFSGGADTYIRRYDIEPKVYPFDLVGEVHADGEIVAGAWWDLAENLGFDVNAMAEIWHETHLATVNGPDGDEGVIFRDVLLEALYADDDNANLDDGTPNDIAILDAFAEHGITLVANAVVNHEEIAVALPDLEGITIEAELEVDFPLYLGDFTMYWKANTATTWETTLMNIVSGDDYAGDIPAQPEGTIIEYYFEVKDIYGGTATVDPKEVTLDDANLPYFLLVGYGLNHTEDYDHTFGDWVVDPLDTDDASTGIWDVGEPIEIADGSYINQTGNDHTEGSTNLCAFT
ncbi:MAG: hypothetical protein H7X71_03825, partial [Chitinophagales bacterium]|nr:hypothetical protein [Chitinophagales bacterium]